MRVYTCDICGVSNSKNPMRDRRLLQVSYMGKELVLDLRFSCIRDELDICRQCQEHIITAIFKKNCVTEMSKDTLHRGGGGYVNGSSPEMAQDMAASETSG